MVAPAGVNEEIPQEPVKAGEGVDLAGTQAAGAEPAEAVQASAKDEVVPAEVVPPPAAPVEDDTGEAAPAAETAPAAEAEPTGSEHAEAGTDGPDWDAGDESRDVSPLAVVGIILGIMALVGAAVVVLAVVTHGFRPKTVVTYRPAAAFGLRPGECINSGASALDVSVVSCATPHDAEVFARFSLPDTGWPGDSVVQDDAGNGCQSRLDGYLNPQLATADLTQEYIYPNQAAWQAGVRTVVCEVRSVSGQLTGSVRATA
jgi:hypothetical protein